jgi:hypothetical protein
MGGGASSSRGNGKGKGKGKGNVKDNPTKAAQKALRKAQESNEGARALFDKLANKAGGSRAQSWTKSPSARAR